MGDPKADSGHFKEDICEHCKVHRKDHKFVPAIPDSITKLQNLKDLDLTQTAITGFPKMDGCSSLTDLNLESCKELTAKALVEFCSHPPPMLQKLNLRDTNLETLPKEIGRLQKLKELCLGECYLLTGLPNEIGNLQSLAKLYCGGCSSLQSLPEGIFDLLLKSLNISICNQLPLDVIGTICQKMPQLESLDLSGLEMTALPKEIGELSKLKTLALFNCQSLGGLPNEIGNLQSLAKLYCGGCSSLQITPDEISKLQNLIELGLSDTAITTVPDSIFKLQNLKVLNLDGTAITVDKTALQAQLPNLRQLIYT